MDQTLRRNAIFKSTHEAMVISFRTWTNEYIDMDGLAIEVETGCAHLVQSLTIEGALILSKNIEDVIAIHTERQIQRRLTTS